MAMQPIQEIWLTISWEQFGEVVVYPRTSDEEKVERAKDADIITC